MKWIEIAKWVITFVASPEGQDVLHLSEELVTYLWLHRPDDVNDLPSLVQHFKKARQIN